MSVPFQPSSPCGSVGVLEWAQQEFAHADLGHRARSTRLVRIAAQAAQLPHGRISEVFSEAMDLEAAYRFVENDHVTAEKIIESSAKATIARCEGLKFIYVPVDQSSLALVDPHQTRGTGHVGTYQANGRGLQVMTAIGVDPQGATLGLLHQVSWAREEDATRRSTKAKRGIEEKETRFWMAVCKTVCARFQEAKSTVIPWFQIDRGGDFKELLTWIAQSSESEAKITVRGTHDRRLAVETNQTYVREHLRSKPVVATYEVEVDDDNRKQSNRKKTKPKTKRAKKAERKKRLRRRSKKTKPVTTRTAKLGVRACRVEVRLKNNWTKQVRRIELNAVLVREEGTTPKGKEPIEWLLWTNSAITTPEEVIQVALGYSLRWRIEDFHRTWKSVCHVEKTQLHGEKSIEVWGTILASVALRIERIKHLARTRPEEPATVEFTQEEIDAVIVLKRPTGWKRGEVPPLGEFVRWVAELGGYRGEKSSGGPPGTTVIRRGMNAVKPAVRVLRNLAREAAEKTFG